MPPTQFVNIMAIWLQHKVAAVVPDPPYWRKAVAASSTKVYAKES